jgi:hypothetical protein
VGGGGGLWIFVVFFSLSLNGQSLPVNIVIIFCGFCCLFLVLENARRVFDKMSETSYLNLFCLLSGSSVL